MSTLKSRGDTLAQTEPDHGRELCARSGQLQSRWEFRRVGWAKLLGISLVLGGSVAQAAPDVYAFWTPMLWPPEPACFLTPPGYLAFSAPGFHGAVFGTIWVGEGLPLNADLLTDTDDCEIEGEFVEQTFPACVVQVTVIDPYGRSTVWGGNCSASPALESWEHWRAQLHGWHQAIVTIGDDGSCCTEDAETYVFSFLARGHDLCDYCDNQPFVTGLHGEFGVVPRFPLGMTIDGKSAGSLYIPMDEPSTTLATPAGLKYWPIAEGVGITEYGIHGELQIETPQLVADVNYLDDYSYEIRYYALDDLEDPYRKWLIENPDGSQDYNELVITEYVDDGTGTLVTRARYEYEGEYGSLDWVVTTIDYTDSQSPVELQTETLTWDEDGNDHLRLYTVTDPGDIVLYQELDRYAGFDWADEAILMRTQNIIDPTTDPNDPNAPVGLDLITTWTYSVEDYGIVLESEKRPDGSWTWYDADFDGGDWVVHAMQGWKDEDYPNDPNNPPAVSGSGVRGTTLKYEHDNDYQLDVVQVQLGGVTVSGSTYSYDTENDIETVTVGRWLDTNGSSTLTTEIGYPDDDLARERPCFVRYPDGRWEAYNYLDEISFTPSVSLPGTPPTYNTGAGGDCYYRDVWHGKNDSGSFATVSNKSTRDVVILNGGGQRLFAETWVVTGAGDERIGWTAWTYDSQNRVTGVYHSNGTSQTTSYDSCCTRTVTDSTGVETEYEIDLLNRIKTITRSAISSYGAGGVTYPAQTAIVTDYDYDTPGEVTVTVESGSLSQETVREYDMAKRLIAVTTGSGAGELKTLYKYVPPDPQNELGRRVITYYDYPTTATDGTAGTRDRVAEYHLDGQIKEVSGSTVVETHYGYDSSGGETSIKVATGTSLSSPRYEKTYYDMLGRVDRVERPGWAATGSVTLTTSYTYDDAAGTGRLTKITHPDRDDTVYEYGDLAQVQYTGLDLNGDGDLDLDGTDRVTETVRDYSQEGGNDWWQRSRSWVYATDNSDTATEVGYELTRLTGFTGDVVSERRSVDVFDQATIATTLVDADHALVIQRTVPEAGSSYPAEQHIHGGRLTWTTTEDGVETSYAYDDLGRQTVVTDGRGNETETGYDASGRVIWVDDGADKRTEYGYYGSADDHPGRLYYVENPADKRTYYAYNDRGQVEHVWGHVPYPTETVYDTIYGQRTQLKTYRGQDDWTGSSLPASPQTADVTTWQFDDATGLLEEKEDASGEEVTYTYTSYGQLDTRTWARGDTTTYDYDDETGELTDIDYSDPNTPDVTFTYDRLGRLDTITDAAGTRTMGYDSDTLGLATETFATSGGVFNGKVITQVYEGSSGTVEGRFVGLEVGTTADSDAYYAAGYAYDAYGRLNHVTGPGLPTGDGTYNGAWYTFDEDSALLEQVQFKNSSNTVLGWSDRSYEGTRDLVTGVENNFGTLASYTTLSEYTYAYNDLRQREYKQRAEIAFTGSFYEEYSYDDRHQLTDSVYYTGTYDSGTVDTSKDREYIYDNLGNRETHTAGTDPEADYVVNELNQYTQLDLQTANPVMESYAYDEDGNLTHVWAAADMNCDGELTTADINAFWLAAFNREQYESTYPDCNWLNGDLNGDGTVSVQDTSRFASMLASGNGAMTMTYTWDGENRLIAAEPICPNEESQRITCTYDYRNRRIEKQVFDWDNQAEDWEGTPSAHTKFMYHDSLLVLELNGLDGDAVLRKYTWGRDLSGALSGAGGIGGLLSVYDTSEAAGYVYFYDAAGNVGQVVDLSAASASASMVAKYEYDPFGQLFNSDGAYDDVNPFRFSTKYHDDETGLIDFGTRYYSPQLGRWLNRDPISELGGLNIYAFVSNDPPDRFDPLGLASASCSGCGGDDGLQRVVPGFPSFPGVSNPDMLATTIVQLPPDVILRFLNAHCRKTHACSKGEASYCLTTGRCTCLEGGDYCPTYYGPPDFDRIKRNKHNIDCVGVACRLYDKATSGEDYIKERGFSGPHNCSKPCADGEVKCYFWKYKVQYKTSDYEQNNNASHMACGQQPPGGGEPQCYSKDTIYGDLEGPMPCSQAGPKPFKFKDPETGDTVTVTPSDIGEPSCFCGPPENLP